MKTYTVYVFEAYDFYDKSKDLYMNVVNIEVIASNEKQAMELAKKRFTKPSYKIVAVYDKVV